MEENKVENIQRYQRSKIENIFINVNDNKKQEGSNNRIMSLGVDAHWNLYIDMSLL